MDSKERKASESESSPPLIRLLYLASLVVLMGAFGMGNVAGYTALAEDSMKKNESKVHDIMTDEENATWFSSLMAIGALVGGLVAGPLCEAIGRKKSLMLTTIPFVGGWVLIYFATNVPMLFIGRFLTGFCCGTLCVVAPAYIVEMATPEVRGFLGSCFQLFVVIGILFIVGIGTAVEYTWLALISIVAPVIMCVGLIFMPESPRWLLEKNRKEEALKAIKFLHGNFVDPEKEVDIIEKTIADRPTGKVTLRELKRPAMWKSSVFSLGLMFFQQFSGANAFVMYTKRIFEESGSSLSPTTGTILVDAVQVLATILGSVLADRAGRKILLLASGFVGGIALMSFGIFDYMKEQRGPEVQDSFGWVPVTSLMLYVSVFSVGIGPLAWVMVAEMVPVRIKGPVTGVSIALNWACVFLITKTYNMMNKSLHVYGTYWFYAAVAFVSCVFTIFCLPETKGKSLEEVQEVLGGTGEKSESKETLDSISYKF